MATGQATFLTPLISDPNFRFKTSQLRKLMLEIQTNGSFQHFALWPLLQSCRETLEEFTFIQCVGGESNFIFPGPTSQASFSFLQDRNYAPTY